MATDILELCKEFAALPIGTVVRFEEGVDFTVKPVSFRNKLHRQMRNEGFIVQSVLRNGAVYAKVKRAVEAGSVTAPPQGSPPSGHALGDANPVAPQATGSGEATGSGDPGPVVASLIVPGPTNPLVPVAVFTSPAV